MNVDNKEINLSNGHRILSNEFNYFKNNTGVKSGL